MSRYNNTLIATAIRPDAKLGKLTVSRIGKYYAFTEDLDGFSSVEVKPQQFTPTERDFYCGNPYKRTQVLDDTVTDVVLDVSASFPNLSTVIVGNTTQVVTGLDTMIGDLQGVTFVVPNSLQADYVVAYPNLTFTSWTFQVEFTIPYIGDSELTAEYVKLVVEHSSGDVSIVDKVIVPAEFTSFETGVFDYIFLKFPNCEEIEYGGLPSAYQAVEYIEKAEGGPYINPNFIPTTGHSYQVSIDFEPLAPSAAGENWIFAIYRPLIWRFGWMGNDWSKYQTWSWTNAYPNRTIATSTYSPTDANTANSVYLFAQNENGPVFVNSGLSKLYSFTVLTDGVKSHQFVPCYRKSDNAIGLYDLVGNQFYTNQGTGTFLKGNDTTVTDVTETISRPALSTCHIYHDENTSHTLTAQIVQETLTRFPEYASCEKVVVDEWFTEYESGSINAIISAFSDMEVLVTTYRGGTIDLDMNGDIVAKIIEIGKTVEEALVYAKTIESTYHSSSNVNMRSDSQLVLFPPISVNKFVVQNGQGSFHACTNLVAVMNPISSVAQDYGICRQCNNLVSFEFRCNATANGGSWMMAFGDGCSSLKRVTIDYKNQITLSEDAGFGLNKSLDKLIYTNLANNFCVYYINQAARPELTKDVMVSFFQSLGTPVTTKTVYLGSTNLAKLTAEDIAIATNKGWVVQ